MDELTSLQQTLTTNVSSDILNQLLGWIVVPLVTTFAVFLVFFIARAIHRHRVDQAIFEIRDNLRELKAQQTVNSNEPVAPTSIDAPSEQQ